MRGLDPRIHPSSQETDCRVEPGNDNGLSTQSFSHQK